jgi:glutaredoxin-related protein
MSTAFIRPRIQFKDFSRGTPFFELLSSHHTLLFVSRDERGELTRSSLLALSYMERFRLDFRSIEVSFQSDLEQILQNYSGWQYFPQLYVCKEFIGGNIVIPEFLRSGEYARVLAENGIAFAQFAASGEAPVLRSVWKLASSEGDDQVLIARADGSLEVRQPGERSGVRFENCHDGWVNTVRFGP